MLEEALKKYRKDLEKLKALVDANQVEGLQEVNEAIQEDIRNLKSLGASDEQIRQVRESFGGGTNS
jgi:hypothetical protein